MSLKSDLSLVTAGAVIGMLLSAAAILKASPAHARAAARQCGCEPLTFTDDLPLRELRAPHPNGTLAVLITGDGGWRAIDRDVAAGLNRRGVSVVGLVAPSFFSERKSPGQAACALQRVIASYTIAWRSPRVIVVGYSRGAGVAPFMVNRLGAVWQHRVAALALIGLESTIDFQVTPFDLFRSAPAPHEIPVRGEIERLRGKRILCFYGEREADSLCRELSGSLFTRVREPGGHHFAGNYDDLARTIWAKTRG